MGLFSSIGGIIGAGKAKEYSKKAMKAQVASANKGIGEVQGQWNWTTGQFEPYLAAGKEALGQYGDLMGLGGADAQQTAIQGIKESPFYQSLYRTGEESVLQNASATGGIRGGNTTASLYNLGEDTLMKSIEHQMQALGGQANMGFSGVNSLSAFGAQKAGDIANLNLGIGAAKAADYGRRAALTQSMWTGAGSVIDQGIAAAASAGMGAGGMPFDFGQFLGNLGGVKSGGL